MITLQTSDFHRYNTEDVLPFVQKVSIDNTGCFQVPDELSLEARELVKLGIGVFYEGEVPAAPDGSLDQVLETQTEDSPEKKMTMFMTLLDRLSLLETELAFSKERIKSLEIRIGSDLSDGGVVLEDEVDKSENFENLTPEQEAYIKLIEESTVEKLKEIAEELQLPKSEWNLLNKAKLKEYLVAKVKSVTPTTV